EVLCPPGRVVATRRLHHRRSAETADSLIADEPGVAARLWVGTDDRDHFAPLLRRHPTAPQVGRFTDVRIRVDHRSAQGLLDSGSRTLSITQTLDYCRWPNNCLVKANSQTG